MRLAFCSLAVALMLTACGGAAAPPMVVAGTVTGSGLQMTLLSAFVRVEDRLPYLEPPPGGHCASYVLQVQSVDGRRHDLRPGQFQAGAVTPVNIGVPVGTPASAVGRCGGPQLEPTWIGGRPRVVVVTILETGTDPAPLNWFPNSYSPSASRAS